MYGAMESNDRQLHNRTYLSQSQVVATNLEDNPKRTLTYNALSHVAHCLQKQPINTHYYTYKKKLRKLIRTIPQSYMLASILAICKSSALNYGLGFQLLDSGTH
jgi:hypothetical protein